VSSQSSRTGEQSVRQRARRATLEAQAELRAQRAERERRLSALGVAVTVAVGERNAAVVAWERRAGEALRTMTDTEGLSLREAVAWCGPDVTARDAARLRDLAATVEQAGPVEAGPVEAGAARVAVGEG
jgi:hypothetical protein